MSSPADDYMRALDASLDALRAGDAAGLTRAQAAADHAREDLRAAHERSFFTREAE
ncbi:MULTISPECIES: hypothetical protein [unclassified Bradyrhizobium]|uniref:hypothetical protein n=1 Tax=unclassified Bradyrhizobium TaxID=2631580 RepID=UPI0029162621|nr:MULTISPECIES: hypothetical protein [unclassified Bradyrhizobium]